MNMVRRSPATYMMLLPFFVLYMYFTFYPIVKGFIISLQDYQILGEKTFVGWQNYRQLFADPTFWASVWHTVLFTLLSVPILVIVGFLLALLVNVPMRGQTFFRAVFFMPMILSVSVVSSVWTAILGSYGGLVDALLNAIGVKQQIFWLTDSKLAWVSILLITTWWTAGFNMVLYLAGLQEIPAEHYEAATIDGANAWQRLRYITIPGLRRVTVLVVFLQIIASFKVFAQVYLVTGGGPAGATRTLIQYIYEHAFNQFLFGPGAAASYVLFAMIFIVSLLQLRLISSAEQGG
ncbi:sugar ABC transporter permease [Alicyclobacillus cellulosilyticus]|uniref:Sugar ABC transporter permease n=1 Tax=Alicyclobacillus cellulosilyticus TaxID=1003997 RepID=A0A917NKW8_9BACL|nr:sugar ABC transporter permease [Alicyclobacillus cellulosilyticus]GGJ08421.1 sugar ABC transporter permease [Alicyclobacillus cellulosilyticus]